MKYLTIDDFRKVMSHADARTSMQMLRRLGCGEVKQVPNESGKLVFKSHFTKEEVVYGFTTTLNNSHAKAVMHRGKWTELLSKLGELL